jgi:ABC-type phosphate transport system substrate-binding protein
LKSSEWTSAEGRGKFISSLREEVDRYIGEASAKAADDKLTKWERVWNVVMWNSPSKNQTTVDIMKAVQTLLNPNSTDQALQNAYVTLRNRNHSHIQSGL